MEFIPYLPIYVPTYLPVYQSHSARTSVTRVNDFSTEGVVDDSVIPRWRQLEMIANNALPETPVGDNLREQDSEESEESHYVDHIPSPSKSTCTLMFLLPSDQRQTMSFESDTGIAKVKELIWNAWPSGSLYSPVQPLRSLKTCHWASRVVRKASSKTFLPATLAPRQVPEKRRLPEKYVCIVQRVLRCLANSSTRRSESA